MLNLTDDCILRIAEYCDILTAQNLRIALQQKGDIIYFRLKPTYLLSKITSNVNELLEYMRKYNVILGGGITLDYFKSTNTIIPKTWNFYCDKNISKFKEYLETKGYAFNEFKDTSGVIYTCNDIIIIHITELTPIDAVVLSSTSLYQCYISADHAVHTNWSLTDNFQYLDYVLDDRTTMLRSYRCGACNIKADIEDMADNNTRNKLIDTARNLRNLNIPFDIENIYYVAFYNALNTFNIEFNFGTYKYEPLHKLDVYHYIIDYHREKANCLLEPVPTNYHYHKYHHTDFNVIRIDELCHYLPNFIPFFIRDRHSGDKDTLTINFTGTTHDTSLVTWSEICHIDGDRTIYKCHIT